MSDSEKMTIEQAMEALGVDSQSALARIVGVSRQAVSLWNGEVPELRQFQIRELARSK